MKMLAIAAVALGLFLWLGGYHIVWRPTPDQLYGCTVAQQASNGDCP